MRRRGGGRVILVASINGLFGFAGKSAYNSAKHGLTGLTRVAALGTAGTGITVNALWPGYVDTPLVRGQPSDLAQARGLPVERVLEEVIYPLVPQRRLLQAQEVADYALFLASDRAQGVTGQAVVIDGGYTAQQPPAPPPGRTLWTTGLPVRETPPLGKIAATLQCSQVGRKAAIGDELLAWEVQPFAGAAQPVADSVS